MRSIGESSTPIRRLLTGRRRNRSPMSEVRGCRMSPDLIHAQRPPALSLRCRRANAAASLYRNGGTRFRRN
ncbi:hypothetical protein [Lysobacter gummosus]|uniref:hypothetical protein n=1 Tax=Lysobacter gummosus TaxID=262324 RepID=UPI0036360812